MNHGKRPTVAQKKLMQSRRLDPGMWLVVKDTPEKMEIVHRLSDRTVRVIPKGGHDG